MVEFSLARSSRAITGSRGEQEDALRFWQPYDHTPDVTPLLTVIADGMGGHVGGAAASAIASEAFLDAFSTHTGAPGVRLDHALFAANTAINAAIQDQPNLKGMGCTLIAAYITSEGLHWVSVGDSLLLLYRTPDLIRLNADHSLGSLLDEQARRNMISREQARSNRRRHALRSAITGGAIHLYDFRSEPLELRHGDWVIVATDGLLQALDGEELSAIISENVQQNPDNMADRLIAALIAKKAVKQDNTTIGCIRLAAAPNQTLFRARYPHPRR